MKNKDNTFTFFCDDILGASTKITLTLPEVNILLLREAALLNRPEIATPLSGHEMFIIGEIYDQGLRVTRDIRRAAYWYRRAIEGGERRFAPAALRELQLLVMFAAYSAPIAAGAR
jgi:hypothetical protein